MMKKEEEEEDNDAYLLEATPLWKEHCMALACGSHPRLGANSPLFLIDSYLIRDIALLAFYESSSSVSSRDWKTNPLSARCSCCWEQFRPLLQEYEKPFQETKVYLQCLSCEAIQCPNHAFIYDKKEYQHFIKDSEQYQGMRKEIAVEGAANKRNSTAFNGEIIEIGEILEDEEPTKCILGTCGYCHLDDVFLKVVVVGIKNENLNGGCCTRCGGVYSNRCQCLHHSGKHEMPVDINNKPCYGIYTSDIGGWLSISSVHRMAFVGRWTCCGGRCFHNTPQCPLYVNQYFLIADLKTQWLGRTPFYDLEEDPISIGCKLGYHQRRKKEQRQQNIDPDILNVPNGIETGVWSMETGTINLDWRNSITWNVSPPHHYPSGHPYTESIEMEFYT